MPEYFICLLTELIAGWKFSAVLCAINTFYIAISWYVEVCIDDLQTIFHEIDTYLTDIDDNGPLRSIELKRMLLEAVYFHRKIIR